MSVTGPTADARPQPLQASEFSFWTEMRTRNRDTDQFGHVNHAAMASLLEESRIDLVFGPQMDGETDHQDLLIAQLTMNFHKELRAPGAVRVGARVLAMGSSSLRIEQGIFQEEVCVASALAVCVLIAKATRRPDPISEAARSRFEAAG